MSILPEESESQRGGAACRVGKQIVLCRPSDRAQKSTPSRCRGETETQRGPPGLRSPSLSVSWRRQCSVVLDDQVLGVGDGSGKSHVSRAPRRRL